MRGLWVAVRNVVVFLLLLEAFLQAGGVLTRTSQVAWNALLAQRKDTIRVLCIGESTTLVGGRESYPALMEEALNRDAGSRRFQVINQGMAGVTTAMIVRDLPGWLDSYRPDIVVAMIGILDSTGGPGELRPEPGPGPFKLLALVRQILAKARQDLAAFGERQWRQVVRPRKTAAPPVPAREVPPVRTEHEEFVAVLAQQPREVRDLYLLILRAKAAGRSDIAEALYEKFLHDYARDVLFSWVVKQYAALLVDAGKFDKFVDVMEFVSYDAWSRGWVPGYCHGEASLERVRSIIERMVLKRGVSPLVYGYVAACYEEGGRPDLAGVYQRKMGAARSSYEEPQTRKNYHAVKELVLARGAVPVFVQYPMRDVRRLTDIFDKDRDRDRILFVDNGPSFQEAVLKRGYDALFMDRASGDTGHATPDGNRLLARNVAEMVRRAAARVH